VSTLDRDHRDYLMALAHCFLQNGHTLEAAVVFRGVTALWPQDHAARTGLAHALCEAGHTEAALNLIEELLAKPPPDDHRSLLQLLRRRARWKLGYAEPPASGDAIAAVRSILPPRPKRRDGAP